MGMVNFMLIHVSIRIRKSFAFSLIFLSFNILAAEHPDFTGVWGTYREPGQTGFSFRSPPPDLPLTEEGRKKVEEYRRLVEGTDDSPGGWCLGTGMPGSMLGSGGYPMEIVQHEDLLIVVYEAHAEIRRIYLQDPTDDKDLFPDRNGYSFGHWQGDKLIVETSHLKEAVDQRRYPHSINARIIEEYEMSTLEDGRRVLAAKMTMTDPDFYTEVIKTEKKWQYLPGTRLLPYECNEPSWYERLDELREEKQ